MKIIINHAEDGYSMLTTRNVLLVLIAAVVFPQIVFSQNACTTDCQQNYDSCTNTCEQDYGADSPNRGQPISEELEIQCSGSYEQAYEENRECYDESTEQYRTCANACGTEYECIQICVDQYNERNAEICGPIYLDMCYARCTTTCNDDKQSCDGNCTITETATRLPSYCDVEIQRIYDGVSADGVSDISFTAVPSGEYDLVDINIFPLPGEILRGTIEKPNPTTVIFTPDEADEEKDYLIPQTALVVAKCIPKDGTELDKVEKTETFTIEQPPLFFVHGFNSDSSVWANFEGRATTDGWQFEHISYPGQQDIALSAQQLAGEIQDFINRIKRGQFYGGKLINANKVDIVSHSMGGLVTRSYIGSLYQGDIRKFLMLGTPNHGAWDAKIAQWVMGGLAVQQLKPNSAFLNALNLLPLNPEIEYHTIAGTGWLTDTAILWGTWKGDGLVPVASVQLPGVPLYCTYDAHSSAVYWAAAMGPTALVNNGGGWTTSEGGTLTTSDAAYGITKSAVLDGTATSVANCDTSEVLVEDMDLSEELIITVKSPVILHAYDQEGNHLGPDAQGNVENGIGEGAFYSTDAEHQTIKIMGNRQIVVRLVGQEQGMFTLDVWRMDAEGDVTTQTFESVETAPGVLHVLDTSAEEWELLEEAEESGETATCFPALLLLGLLGMVGLKRA